MTDEELKELQRRAKETQDIDELRGIGMAVLRYLWENDPDPNKQPWPGEHA